MNTKPDDIDELLDWMVNVYDTPETPNTDLQVTIDSDGQVQSISDGETTVQVQSK